MTQQQDRTDQIPPPATMGQPPMLMTEAELIEYLRIRHVSKAADYGNVIAHLKRHRDLPCLHICRQPLYPREAIDEWVRRETGKGAG